MNPQGESQNEKEQTLSSLPFGTWREAQKRAQRVASELSRLPWTPPTESDRPSSSDDVDEDGLRTRKKLLADLKKKLGPEEYEKQRSRFELELDLLGDYE